jgi:hypothetical protein
MEPRTVTLTSDEWDDVRFALTLLADEQETRAAYAPSAYSCAALEQAERMRRIAKKVEESTATPERP